MTPKNVADEIDPQIVGIHRNYTLKRLRMLSGQYYKHVIVNDTSRAVSE
jgi:hypothetical protein